MQPQELPPLQAHHADPRTGIDELGGTEIMSTSSGLTSPSNANLSGSYNALGELLAMPKAEPVRVRKTSNVDPKVPSTWGKVSRNESCPCGSGKKFKHCHGKLD